MHDTTPEGFAAIKLTALGSPALLQQISEQIVETRNLFRRFDRGGRGVLSRSDFRRSFTETFVDYTEAEVDALFEQAAARGGVRRGEPRALYDGAHSRQLPRRRAVLRAARAAGRRERHAGDAQPGEHRAGAQFTKGERVPAIHLVSRVHPRKAAS